MEIKTMSHIKYDSKSGMFVNYNQDDLETIRKWLKQPCAVILKNIFNRQMLDEIRLGIFDFFQTTPESNPDIHSSTLNYHRIDNNPERSAVKGVSHYLASFYWNHAIAGEKDLMRAMTIFKNKVANLPETFTLEGIEKAYDSEWITKAGIAHYPLGGGRLNKHIDPINIQFTTILSMMTEKGRDYHEGGFFIEWEGKRIVLDDYMKAGDVYLVSPEIVHGVDTVDGNQYDGIQWNNPLGRWVLFPALIELKSTYGQAIEELIDLDIADYQY